MPPKRKATATDRPPKKARCKFMSLPIDVARTIASLLPLGDVLSLSTCCRTRHSELVDSWMGRVDWCRISEVEGLSEAFMERHADRLDWTALSGSHTLSEAFIAKHADRVDWVVISWYQVLSEKFVDRHAHRLDWEALVK